MGGKLFGLPYLSLCFVGSNSEVHYDNLQNRLGLPYVRNFPVMYRISLLNFVSGNNFEEYCTLTPAFQKVQRILSQDPLIVIFSEDWERKNMLFCIVSFLGFVQL